MKALVRVTRDTHSSPKRPETTLVVHGKGKASVVGFQFEDGRTVEYDLHDLLSALKGLEMSVR
jgi:hypothetical protein